MRYRQAAACRRVARRRGFHVLSLLTWQVELEREAPLECSRDRFRELVAIVERMTPKCLSVVTREEVFQIKSLPLAGKKRLLSAQPQMKTTSAFRDEFDHKKGKRRLPSSVFQTKSKVVNRS